MNAKIALARFSRGGQADRSSSSVCKVAKKLSATQLSKQSPTDPTDLGLSVLGRDTVSGEWTATAVGLNGNHAKIAMLQTSDGLGRLELFEYIHPDAIETQPTPVPTRSACTGSRSRSTTSGRPSGSPRGTAATRCVVATDEDVYTLTYLRGPSGILVMLAQELKKR